VGISPRFVDLPASEALDDTIRIVARDKATMLRKGTRSHTNDAVTPDEEIKIPYVLEFLGLKDEYSETELEDALIGKLQSSERSGSFRYSR
jgi:hypothetical protein